MFRRQIFLCSLLFVFVQAQEMQFGMEHFPTGHDYFSCGNITFKTPFSSSDVQIYTTLFNKDPAGNTYEAAVDWVEDITATGFKACAVTAGPHRDMNTLVVNWMAFEETPEGAQTGRHTLKSFVAGTACEEIYFPKTFGGTPDVYATPVHKATKENSKDAATLWIENIKPRSFQVCLRELKNFGGEHKAIEVNWMGIVNKPGGKWKAQEKKRMRMLNEGIPPKSRRYSFCQNSTFDKKFFEPPVIITVASHTYDKGNPRSVNPQTNTMSNWIENLDVYGFQVCTKDGVKLKGKHSQIDIQYMAIGDYDPCTPVVCKFYAKCVAFGPSDARCVCESSCPTYENMLCSTAGVTYDNECFHKKAICEKKENIPIAHAGSCRPFILQRGRAQVSLDIVDVQCTDVTYDVNEWYTSLPIHVLITVNYDGSSPGLVHHAITSWVEKISHSKFTTCALKAGRNEYDEGTVPPNFGLTYIDWIAFQGSPRGGVVGEQLISDWWQGTTCTSLTLPSHKFASSPFVLLTAEHTRIGLKHDAATLWTEDVSAGTFRVCMRELQNFDGVHRSINVNWMAFENLPRNFFSERSNIHFANTNLPLESDRFAYCKVVEFHTSYEDVPTVLLSATHSSTSHGALSPKHNSIASWVEYIDKHGFTACIKELNDEAKYDPVDVHWVALPECNRALNVASSSAIPDSAITASSELDSSTPARLGRIAADPKNSPFSWCASSNVGQWLQVDLGHLYVVSGVATQGSYRTIAWVTMYQLSYGNDGTNYVIYKENSLIKNFTANSDRSATVRRTFQDPVEMRYLRFIPKTYVAKVCMRVEIYGCDTEPIHVHVISEGCADNPTRCGFSSIEVDGIEYSLKSRGHNIVAMTQEGTIIDRKVFDTEGSPLAGTQLSDFINNLPINTIILISVHESGSKYITPQAENALKSIYATYPITPSYQESWVLIGFKGSPRPSWIRQAHNKSGMGPTIISPSIPLYGG